MLARREPLSTLTPGQEKMSAGQQMSQTHFKMFMLAMRPDHSYVIAKLSDITCKLHVKWETVPTLP